MQLPRGIDFLFPSTPIASFSLISSSLHFNVIMGLSYFELF